MPTQTYTALITTTLDSDTGTLTISSIPSSYRDLILVVNCKPTGTGAKDVGVQFNGDTGANYGRRILTGDGTTAATDTGSSLVVQKNDEDDYSIGVMQINDYSATNKHKPVLVRTNDADNLVSMQVGRWKSTSAISSIAMFYYGANIASGSVISLYGIEA